MAIKQAERVGFAVEALQRKLPSDKLQIHLETIGGAARGKNRDAKHAADVFIKSGFVSDSRTVQKHCLSVLGMLLRDGDIEVRRSYAPIGKRARKELKKMTNFNKQIRREFKALLETLKE